MMLGLLLARAGITVIVVEKHADFLRDFRGDTVHPSTLEVLHELGILEDFLTRPHQEVREIGGKIGDTPVTVADFSHLPTHCKFIVLMPQWDFLDFLNTHASRNPGFELMMQTEVVGLIEENGRVTGVRAKRPNGEVEVRADLVVGADGRQSVVRERAGLEVEDFGAPIDVLWMRLSRRESDPSRTFGYVNRGHVFVMLNRGDYWQCAFVIPKAGFDALRQRGLPAFRQAIVQTVPFMHDRVDELTDWSAVKLLTVKVDRLKEWCRPGLLCIGDAAHAMSPIGGVGVNLAVQDAVAAANILWQPLRSGAVSEEDLARVQTRREFPTRVTQRIQIFMQNNVIGRALGAGKALEAPLALRLIARFAPLRRIPARIIAVGVRPEHVHSPDVQSAAPDASTT
jgi:2-polyprenyl-6-methoxyphenol hydroxylase-like FAD-dependent oxidoreductase